MKRCNNCMSEKVEKNRCQECGHIILRTHDGYALEPGTILSSRYYIGNIIGQGGFGITYVGYDEKLELKVAIKEYFPVNLATRKEGFTEVKSYSDDKSVQYRFGLERFLNEAKVLAKFNQKKGIVSVMDYFEANGTGYLVMEYLEGMTLETYLKNNGGQLNAKEARGIVKDILSALVSVHKAGMIHRDISPDNIYMTDDKQVKILDLGAARHALSEKTNNLTVVLKRGYAPAEQYSKSGNQGPWTDLYSVGATWYQMLTGTEMTEALSRSVGEKYQLPSEKGIEIRAEEEAILMKAVEYMPHDRYQSAEVFLKALSGLSKIEDVVQVFSEINNDMEKDKKIHEEKVEPIVKVLEVDKNQTEIIDDSITMLINEPVYVDVKPKKKQKIRRTVLLVMSAMLSVFACVVIFIVVRNIWILYEEDSQVIDSNIEENDGGNIIEDEEGLASEVISVPILSYESGNYDHAISLELITDKGTIYYTMDGTEPTGDSLIYKSQIKLDKDTEIKAVVITDEGKISEIAHGVYSFYIEDLEVVEVVDSQSDEVEEENTTNETQVSESDSINESEEQNTEEQVSQEENNEIIEEISNVTDAEIETENDAEVVADESDSESNLQSQDFTVYADLTVPYAEVTVSSPEQFLIYYNCPITESLSEVGDKISLELYNYSSGSWETIASGADLTANDNDMLDLVIDMYTDYSGYPVYVVETDLDWEVYFNSASTRQHYFNNDFRIVCEGLTNSNNGLKGEVQYLQLFDVITYPDSFVPVIVNFEKGENLFYATFSESIKIGQYFNNESATVSLSQGYSTGDAIDSQTSWDKVTNPYVVFVSEDGSKRIEGEIINISTDDTTISISPTEILSDGMWTLEITGISDDVGNQANINTFIFYNIEE